MKFCGFGSGNKADCRRPLLGVTVAAACNGPLIIGNRASGNTRLVEISNASGRAPSGKVNQLFCVEIACAVPSVTAVASCTERNAPVVRLMFTRMIVEVPVDSQMLLFVVSTPNTDALV